MRYHTCSFHRGKHKLHVQLNGVEINGSPFTMTVYPDPTKLVTPRVNVTDLNRPYGIAFNSHGIMIVSECGGEIAIREQTIRTVGKCPEQMKYPKGIYIIAIDDMDNIYVSSSLYTVKVLELF